MDLENLVKQWRAAGNALRAKDPDDRAADGYMKAANDLEIAMTANKPAAIFAAFLAAVWLLSAETVLERPHQVETAAYTESATTYTLAPRNLGMPEAPPVDTDDTEREGALPVRFTPNQVSAALGIDWAGVFLPKHRVGNPGGNTELFVRTERGRYRLKEE